MDVYPLAEKTSLTNVDKSVGNLNKYGTLCLIDEIQKRRCLLLSEKKEVRENSWKHLTKTLEERGVQRASVINIQFTWKNLLNKYFEWKENPKSNTSFHACFRKMTTVDGSKKDDWFAKEIQEDHHAQNDGIVRAEGPGALKLPQSLQYTYALIEAVKKINSLLHGTSYALTAGKLASFSAIKKYMKDDGFEEVKDTDILATWKRLLEIYELGKKDQLKTDLARKFYQKMEFLDHSEMIEEVSKSDAHNSSQTTSDQENTDHATSEEYNQYYRFFFFAIAILSFLIMYGKRV